MTHLVSVADVFGFLDPKELLCVKSNFSCTADLLPPCRSLLGFDIPSLWNITQNYNASCPKGPWLVPTTSASNSNFNVALTSAAAVAIVGAGFKLYPTADIWYRLTTWKFPLFQLLATSPRPPLSLAVECFTIVHLMGNPWGALQDLLYKFESCQARAVLWQAQFRLPNNLRRSRANTALQKTTLRMWKGFAIISDSYDEWGFIKGDSVTRKLQDVYSQEMPEERRKAFVDICLQTAGALAADRSTRFLPVAVAQAFFIGAIAIAMIRTKSIAEQKNPSTFINIEMHSIAFSALFFWLISEVIMTSVIGASQTAEAIPRILGRFAADLKKADFNLHLDSKEDLLSDTRKWKGGIHAWQPESNQWQAYHNSRIERRHNGTPTGFRSTMRRFLLSVWPLVYLLLPMLIFAAAILTGMTMSFFVPPLGWSCRSEGEMIIAIIWISSYLLSFVGRYLLRENTLFVFEFVKDPLAFLGTMAMVMATQFGIYNKVGCYTKYGTVGLALPLQGLTNSILQAGLKVGGSYTVIVTLGVLVQLVLVPSLLLRRYYDAIRVFLQRDDGTSNLDVPRLRSFLSCCWRWLKRICCCGKKRRSQDVEAAGNEMDDIAVDGNANINRQPVRFPAVLPQPRRNRLQEPLQGPDTAHVQDGVVSQRRQSQHDSSVAEVGVQGDEERQIDRRAARPIR